MTSYMRGEVVNPKTASEFAYIMSDIKMQMKLMQVKNQSRIWVSRL